MITSYRAIIRGIVLLLCISTLGVAQAQPHTQSITFKQLHEDTIINSDLWSAQPEILSAGYGFDGIIGVEGEETEVRAAGGTWNTVTCSTGDDPARNVLTSSATPRNVETVYDNTVAFADGLPVVFSYPILPSTLSHTDFMVTLNTGDRLIAEAASIYPNFEYNERHVAVIFGDFGNRLLPDEAGARYPIRVEVVEDGIPLTLVGPDGLVSAVGLFKESDNTPYASGPYLVGAKLNHLSTEGEGVPRFLSSNLPNDGEALYGEAAQYRLRIFTSGGFSPDGVRGVLPTEFARFFRLHAQGADGNPTLITETGVDYAIAGGTVRVLGLAELGLAEAFDRRGNPEVAYDDCYVEDHDNYIDIILGGDEEAMRHITYVEIPAESDDHYIPLSDDEEAMILITEGELPDWQGYDVFYNPGGPGNNPTPGVRYTAPGPADLEPVIIALDDPMTVSYGD